MDRQTEVTKATYSRQRDQDKQADLSLQGRRASEAVAPTHILRSLAAHVPFSKEASMLLPKRNGASDKHILRLDPPLTHSCDIYRRVAEENLQTIIHAGVRCDEC